MASGADWIHQGKACRGKRFVCSVNVKVESGTRNFRIFSLISIARALGLSTDYLLGLANYDDTLNIQLLLSVLDEDGKAFIKDVIRLYIKSTQ